MSTIVESKESKRLALVNQAAEMIKSVYPNAVLEKVNHGSCYAYARVVIKASSDESVEHTINIKTDTISTGYRSIDEWLVMEVLHNTESNYGDTNERTIRKKSKQLRPVTYDANNQERLRSIVAQVVRNDEYRVNSNKSRDDYNERVRAFKAKLGERGIDFNGMTTARLPNGVSVTADTDSKVTISVNTDDLELLDELVKIVNAKAEKAKA